MHVVIIGAGRIGAAVARWLVSGGHEVAVIDRDRTRCNALEEELGSVTVVGGGTNSSVLSKAGANRADALIATTGRDDVNLVAAQLAKHRYGVAKTISVVNSAENSGLFGALGIDVVVDMTELALGRIQEGVSTRGLVHLMPVSDLDGRTLVSIKVPAESEINGRTVKDIDLPDGALLSLVISRDGNASIPNENTVIRAGDEVVAVTPAREEEDLRDRLVRRNGE